MYLINEFLECSTMGKVYISVYRVLVFLVLVVYDDCLLTY